MATTHGLDGKLYIGSNPVGEVTGFSIDESAATADDSAMNDTDATHLVGLKSWQGSRDFWFDPADTTGQGAMTIGASVVVHFYPEGNATGDQDWTGTATVTALNTTVSRDGTESGKVSLLGNGALTKGTVS